MKFLRFIPVLFVFACSLANSPTVNHPTELASTSQPLHVPFAYGLENGSVGLKCGPPWEGGRCKIPKNRTFKVTVVASSCPDWYVTRINNALSWLQERTAPYGWNVQITSLGNADYFIGCVSGNTPISFFDPSDQKCQNTQHGQLCKYEGGMVGINTQIIETRPIWQTATNTQRRKWTNNAVKHELLHMLGHGHFPGSQGGTKLMAQGFPLDLTCPAWNEDLDLDPVEEAAVDCFNPSSSTNSLCGDN